MSFTLDMTLCKLQVEEGNAILAFPVEMTAQDPAQHTKLQKKRKSFCLFWALLKTLSKSFHQDIFFWTAKKCLASQYRLEMQEIYHLFL